MRITTTRIISQVVFFGIFVALSLVTTFAYLDQFPALKFWLSKFLEIDPLIAASTAIATHTLYKGLVWSLVLLIPTLLLGRFFCTWVCPYGALHHAIGWVLNRRTLKQKIESNRYRPLYRMKYYLLLAMLAASLFGVVQIGLLDPICLVHRSFTVAVEPAWDLPVAAIESATGVDMAAWRFRREPAVHQLGWVIGVILFALVAANVAIPRFFCRVLCPLGATLGILSRFSLWGIQRDRRACTDCGLCNTACEGACEPDGMIRRSECLVCFNCIEDCPHGALSFAFLPDRDREVTNPDLTGRRAAFATLAGLAAVPFVRSSTRTSRDFSAKAIRPPGSVEEIEFLERCVKCDQCARVCPTNVIQPAMLEAGVEGMWTPVMNYRVGFCQLNCTACGYVCPTGAIQQVPLAEKLGLGPYAEAGPVVLGTAHVDRSRCLPWSKNTPCMVCEEICPTSPKAIYRERMQLPIRDGKMQVLDAADNTVRLANDPKPGQATGEPATFTLNELVGDETTRYSIEIIHRTGLKQVHQIVGNDLDTVQIEDAWYRRPERGDVAVVRIEYSVPKVDLSRCIGCGLCEHECPVTGDRRAIYVTAEGESRSKDQQDPHRNRSVRLV